MGRYKLDVIWRYKGELLRHFGSFAAKNKLSQLLQLVEPGEEILITRHGKEVAKLVPAHRTLDRESAKRTAAEIREIGRPAEQGLVRQSNGSRDFPSPSIWKQILALGPARSRSPKKPN